MTKCLICGYYGQGNAGDEALLMSLLEMLPPHVTPIVLSGNPQQTQKRYGVESYSRLSLIPILSKLGKNDCFIWGGGSLMQDATSIRSPLYYAGLMAYAQWRGLTTIAYGQGIGPLNHSLTRWLAKQVLRKCSGITVRDQNSAKLLIDWHIDCIVAPDPVWALSSEPFHGLNNLKSPPVAINLRSHSQLTPPRLENLTQALILFQQATKATILLIPFQESKDLAIAQKIRAALPGENEIISLTNPRELKGLFKQVEMLIGMRLHSLIMAASVGCPCFALSYDPKVSSLMAELNLAGWKLAELPEDANLIKNAWLETYHNQQRLSTEIINSLQEKALLHKQLLEKLIKVES
jgi:polysaccharide pyruvyl transferase CsaB